MIQEIKEQRVPLLTAMIGLLVGVLTTLLVVWILNIDARSAARVDESAATRADVADSFAAAYATGDTKAACGLAADDALRALDHLCARTQAWPATSYTVAQHCTTPTGEAWTYTTGAVLQDDLGFEIVVTGAMAPFRVTSFVSGGSNGNTFCDIYGADR